MVEERHAANPQDAAPKIEQPINPVEALVERYGDAQIDEHGTHRLLDDLKTYEERLAESYAAFRDATSEELSLSYAAEWLLDNYYIIRQALRQIHEDLPLGYYNQLPRLTHGPQQGYPRMYAIARAVLARQRLLVNFIEAQSLLADFQEQAPLTMGELWAFPIFLRYGLLEALTRALASLLSGNDKTPAGFTLPSHGPELISFVQPEAGQEISTSSLSSAVNRAETGGNAAVYGEKQRQPVTVQIRPQDAVANSVLSLRAISEQDWKAFFESVSQVENLLRQDPADIYARMDFESRDLYRRAVEEIALAARQGENAVAMQAFSMATTAAESAAAAGADREDGALADRQAHIGYYLVAEGRDALENKVGARLQGMPALLRWVRRHGQAVFIGGNLLLALLILVLLSLALPREESLYSRIGLTVLLTIPALTAASSLVNWLVTLLLPPQILPKLELRDGIPEPYRTVVVVPTLISSTEEIDSLAGQLQMHYLRNPDPDLSFALLADFTDADAETLPGDEELVAHAAQRIEALNERYERAAGGRPFYFLYRRRLWNQSNGKWMGWERKRGKLHEFNQLILGHDQGLTFGPVTGDVAMLQASRYVITLDADTILPRGAARRMIGALAHPLNRAVFAPGDHPGASGPVTAGYTILQPRMEINPASANRSWFTRIFSGDTGLDLYTLAVSDAYQDMFGEGIFVGKGIYEVASFERSVHGRIPENSLLSHDLLEGIMGRAGLVTDVTMVEDYPPNYFVQAMRNHRWIRGDWQLLPWLLNPGRFKLHLQAIDRWKIIDNLRRSLLAPVLVLIFVLGLVLLPGAALFWTALVLVTLGIPVLVGVVRGGMQTVSGEPPGSAFRPVAWDLLRWLLAVSFLLYEAYIAADAILTTLSRLLITRRHMLQWTTSAATTRILRERGRTEIAWRRMGVALLVALALAAWIIYIRPAALVGAAPVLLLWVLSPQITIMVGRPVRRAAEQLTPVQMAQIRRIARRTWSFFERFVGPEDHWLAPDNFQEQPVGMVAHRTSPTNTGLLLTATLAAYDMGYIDGFGLAARLSETFDTLDKMERFRGHFLNWYDTLTLQPLTPRYVSTVDSGNLAASLIVTAQFCLDLPKQTVFRWELWQGYLDTLSLLSEAIAGWHGSIDREATRPVLDIEQRVEEMRVRIEAVRETPRRWYALYQEISGPFWQELSRELARLIQANRLASRSAASSLTLLRSLQEIATQAERQHHAVQRTIDALVPWIPLMENPPALLREEPFSETLASLRAGLSFSPPLGQIRAIADGARPILAALRERLQDADPSPNPAGPVTTGAPVAPLEPAAAAEAPAPAETRSAALEWVDAMEHALDHAVSGAGALLAGFVRVAARADEFVREMDFRFLYQPQRRVFHIGYNIDAGQLDNNFYDLLASEARIASFIAIAKGDISQQHWLYLARPVTSVNGLRVLLSWSATMFEYLMPPLFLRSYPGTLLEESARGAVTYQISYARSLGLPWGISESGFNRLDSNQTYQYRAFGVPGLGFKRGLADDMVIAPYASLMAISYEPHQVVRNVEELTRLGALGLYGFYESIDFTQDRLMVGEERAVVREYMAHHQGMILLALSNYLHDNIMVRRMHADPRIRSVDLLLQEQVPLAAPLQDPTTSTAKGVQRLVPARVEVNPWSVPVQTPIPQMHLLSNGTYSMLISNSGSGTSTWNEIDLTRWQPDRALDWWGSWLYLQDLTLGGEAWSATFQPVPGNPLESQVTFFAHMAVFRRNERGIISTVEAGVTPDDPVEIRRVHLNNTTAHPHRLRLTTYGEVILTKQSADARHPAFNKLFIDSEWDAELNLQIFHRRPRADDETPVYLGHMLVVEEGGALTGAHEADRARFIGRNGSLRCPEALESSSYLSGSSGATLDPIFSIGQEMELAPHESTRLASLTFAAASREELLALAQRYHNWNLIDRTFQQSDLAAQAWMGRHNIDSQSLRDILRALSALIYPSPASRAAPEILAQNRLGQPALWRFGISGDYPILMVDLDDPRQLDLVREALQMHRFLRSRRYLTDLVILNHQQTDYGAQLNSMLYRLVSRVNSEQWLNQRGGVFILYSDQMQADERALLKTSARLLLTGERGSAADQLPGYSLQVPHLPEFIPISGAEAGPRPADDGETEPLPQSAQVEGPRPPTPSPEAEGRGRGEEDVDVGSSSVPLPLQGMGGTGSPGGIGNPGEGSGSSLSFDNGFGGFTPDGREYVIRWTPGRPTPAPWANVIGYPLFGFMVTEAGSMTTWALNSGENRLTPWSNDPVRDPTGEALYLRDEETGEVWTPTPLPTGTDGPYEVRHGAGYTTFEHTSHDLCQRMAVFASPEDPVKIVMLRLENTRDATRRITATQYVEWVLGVAHASGMPYILPEYDAEHACLLATNPYNPEFGERVAFLAASRPVHGLTADRTEFLGRNGSLQYPASLRRLGLETRITPGEDPCGVMQVHIDLLPGGCEEFYFLIGQGDNRESALALVDKYHQQAQVENAWDRTRVFWDRLLGAVKVSTPNPAFDMITNRWMLYQALSCRIWGRTGFYQSSGAFGFRDQLQDVMAALVVDPAITRGQILNAAHHQFDAGDVLHWWHPPSGRGVRTRISDDLLWLPYVTTQYIEATGDAQILDETAPFLQAPPLRPDEDERYGVYPFTEQSYTLFEHCRRAIEKGATRGANGLPLIGTGDWNDGFNRVGAQGRGESIWLAWFLVEVLERFARLCDLRGEQADATKYRAMAKEYAAAVEQSAWDGAWYRRASYDDGAPLGTSADSECRIDAIAQSWSLISGAGDPARARKAMDSVQQYLVRPDDRLILLFTPPFDQSPRDPGYIKGYLPGIRENGGQYTHAATWTTWAYTLLGDGERAGALFDLLNPIYQADTAEKTAAYRVEPYVICADIYSVEPYLRRGGWTWYTGSAAWMYRLGLEAILGFRRAGKTLVVNPVIPPAWDGFSIDYHFGQSTYHIQVHNPQHIARGSRSVVVDGSPVEGDTIPLTDDGQTHAVEVTLKE